MKTVDYIKAELAMSSGWVMGLIADMKDAPMTRPTPNGGNHPMWILGHLAYSEANMVNNYIQGEANSLIEWKDIFGVGSEAMDDASLYPSFDAVRAKYDEVRASTMTLLETLSDEDLDKPSHAPEESQAFFGTIGQCLAAITIHLSFHGGQIADARRADGRGPLMA